MLGKMKHSRRYGSSEKKKAEKHGLKSSEGNKLPKHRLKSSEERNILSKHGSKSSEGNKLSKETLKQVSDLAFYVRYQKTKIEALKRKPEAGATEQKRLMRKMTSKASVNSMDAFLAKADLDEMARFLSFCGGVTAEKLGGSKPQRDSVKNSVKTTPTEKQQEKRKTGASMKINRRAICESLDSMKLGLKQKFAPSVSTVQRTTSTGTISSTDTGYQSIGSEHGSESFMDEKVSMKSVTNLERDYFPDEPFQSTPVFAGRSRNRRADVNDVTFTGDHTLTAEILEDLDEVHGKSLILEKFITTQTNPFSTEISKADICKHLDVTEKMTESFWNQTCIEDSDIGMDSESSQDCESLDMAFNAGTEDCETENPRKKKLRRESAISNLNSFSLLPRDIKVNSLNESKISSSSLVESKNTANSQQKKLRRESAISNLNCASILTRGTGLNSLYENRALDISDTIQERVGRRQRNLRRESDMFNLNRFSLLSRDFKNEPIDESNFDYSFNCSFPRMDESQTEDFSLDFSCDFDESDSDDATDVEHDDSGSVDSLMNTQLCQDISGEITLC